jgi:hypothetical protein
MAEEDRPIDLVRALEAIGRTQHRWLTDLEQVCSGEPRFLDAFRRWQEWLTLIKLHLVRAEQRLLHFLLVPEERRPWREFPGPAPRQREAWARWEEPIVSYLHGLHIDTIYRRIGSTRDLDGEVINADIATDITALAVLADTTGRALARLDPTREPAWLEDLAFYHVLSPWKLQGQSALHDVLRWLDEFLSDLAEI